MVVCWYCEGTNFNIPNQVLHQRCHQVLREKGQWELDQESQPHVLTSCSLPSTNSLRGRLQWTHIPAFWDCVMKQKFSYQPYTKVCMLQSPLSQEGQVQPQNWTLQCRDWWRSGGRRCRLGAGNQDHKEGDVQGFKGYRQHASIAQGMQVHYECLV